MFHRRYTGQQYCVENFVQEQTSVIIGTDLRDTPLSKIVIARIFCPLADLFHDRGRTFFCLLRHYFLTYRAPQVGNYCLYRLAWHFYWYVCSRTGAKKSWSGCKKNFFGFTFRVRYRALLCTIWSTRGFGDTRASYLNQVHVRSRKIFCSSLKPFSSASVSLFQCPSFINPARQGFRYTQTIWSMTAHSTQKHIFCQPARSCEIE